MQVDIESLKTRKIIMKKKRNKERKKNEIETIIWILDEKASIHYIFITLTKHFVF
jgi:hypothetical protein